MKRSRVFRKAVHWSLFGVVVLKLVTGYGITQFRLVEALTFGLLTKTLAFRIHGVLAIPLMVLLGLHIYLTT